MTRLKVEIPDRLPEEGLHKLHLKRDLPADPKWALVRPELRALFADLAMANCPWPLYLWGDVGHGKSEAVRAFCRRVYRGRYWTVDGIMAERPWQEFWGTVPPLAVLDELGLPRPGEAARNYDYDCVKQFIDWRKYAAAIYVSNHNLETIKRLYDARIVSRLAAGSVFELKDHDRRRRQ